MVQALTTTREIQRATLPNGVRIVTESMPYVRWSPWAFGSVADRALSTVPRMAFLILSNTWFSKTRNTDRPKTLRAPSIRWVVVYAFTSKELVSFNTKVLDEHLPLASDILADLVLHPLFREEDIEKEKGVILEEIKMEADQPEFVLHETFISNFWKGHALGKPILGTKETVKKFGRDSLCEYFSRVYAPKNILITAAGNLDHQKIVELIGEKFSGLQVRTVCVKIPFRRPMLPSY